jgi:hypothetical protein
LVSVVGGTADELGGATTGAIADLDGDGFREFVATGAFSDAGGTNSGVLRCYRLFPVTPETFCTGKVNSLGCTPSIGFSGTPSSAALVPFLVRCSNVISDRTGIFFYSHRPASAAFQGGFLCVLAPVIRTAIQNSGGTPGGGDCLGTYSFDFNDWIVNGFDSSLSTGAEIYGQHWSRDPQSASTTSLSNALRFVINP